VANAHPAVLEIADEVTGANSVDGVAAYLEKVFGVG
jgi:hydroxymethylpyrimidine pyrophosphatase-like HAD family hydrolase